MINIKAFMRQQERKELEDVLEDLSYSLIECNDPLLRSGIQENINDIEFQLDQLDAEEDNA